MHVGPDESRKHQPDDFGPAHQRTERAGGCVVVGEPAGVDQDDARDALLPLDRQPGGRVSADGIADHDQIGQIEAVNEFDCQITELDGGKRGVRGGRLTVTGPVHREYPVTLQQRTPPPVVISAVMESGVEQQDRRALTIVGVGDRPE